MNFYDTKILTRVMKSMSEEELEAEKEAERIANLTGREYTPSESEYSVKEVWTEFNFDLELVSGYYKTLYLNDDDQEEECTHVYWNGLDVIIIDKFEKFKEVMLEFKG